MFVYRSVFGSENHAIPNWDIGYTLEVYELAPLKKGPNVVREKNFDVQSLCSAGTGSTL